MPKGLTPRNAAASFRQFVESGDAERHMEARAAAWLSSWSKRFAAAVGNPALQAVLLDHLGENR